MLTESNPLQGIQCAKDNLNISVAVIDMRMPDMDGIEVLSQLKKHRPDIIRIMLTGNNDIKTAIDAVNSGYVFRFLLKPCENHHLKQALADAVRQHHLEQSEKELLKHTLTAAITLLSDILMLQEENSFLDDPQGRDDLQFLCEQTNAANTWEIEIACRLHKIGIVAIPPDVLLDWEDGKSISSDARGMIQEIPVIGSQF